MEQNDLIFIQNQIGYEFKNLDLLQQAFVRRSYSQENGGENNEVLEFIGDKVLDLFVVKLLITKNSNSVGLYKKFDPKLKNSWSYETEKKSFPNKTNWYQIIRNQNLPKSKNYWFKRKLWQVVLTTLVYQIIC